MQTSPKQLYTTFAHIQTPTSKAPEFRPPNAIDIFCWLPRLKIFPRLSVWGTVSAGLDPHAILSILFSGLDVGTENKYLFQMKFCSFHSFP